MRQPIPKVSEADVRRIIQRDFPSGEENFIMEMLNEFGRDNPAVNRVHLAILKLSGGDLDRLREVLEITRQDFRDVIAPAEYPSYSKLNHSRLSELTEDEKGEIIQKDWRQYQDWLRK
jgi:hypothetical protein